MEGKNTESAISLNLLKYSLNPFRDPSIIQGMFPNYGIFGFLGTTSGHNRIRLVHGSHYLEMPPNIIDRCLQKLGNPRMPEKRLHEHRMS